MPLGDVIGAVSGVSDIVSGSSADNSANNALSAQVGIAQQQAAIGAYQWQWIKDNALPSVQKEIAMYNRLRPDIESALKTNLQAVPEDRQWYEQNVRPVQQQMLQMSQPDYGYVTSKAASDADLAEARARSSMERELQGRGVDPSGGNWKANLRRSFSGQRAGLVNAARENERENSFNRMTNATNETAGLGRETTPQVNDVASGMTNFNPTGAMSQAGSGLGSAAGSYWNMGSGYANSASQAFQGVDWGAIGDWASGGSSPKPYGSGVMGPIINRGYARGGLVRGPGNGVSDSVPAKVSNPDGSFSAAALSNGEYVMPADQVEQIVREYLQEKVGGLSRRRVI